ENPNGIAVIYQDTQLSYRQFNAWVNRIAAYLASIGLKKGDVVVLDIENRPELLAAVTGCAKIGACAALLNTSQRGEVLVRSINLAEPEAAIIGAELVDAIEEVRDRRDVPADRFFLSADQDALDDAGEAPEGYTN